MAREVRDGVDIIHGDRGVEDEDVLARVAVGRIESVQHTEAFRRLPGRTLSICVSVMSGCSRWRSCRTIFPQMTGCLPEEEGATLRFAFISELEWLKAA